MTHPECWLFTRRRHALVALGRLWATHRVDARNLTAVNVATRVEVRCFVVNAPGDERKLRGQLFSAVLVMDSGVPEAAERLARLQVRP